MTEEEEIDKVVDELHVYAAAISKECADLVMERMIPMLSGKPTSCQAIVYEQLASWFLSCALLVTGKLSLPTEVQAILVKKVCDWAWDMKDKIKHTELTIETKTDLN